jgi:hypothetical protein
MCLSRAMPAKLRTTNRACDVRPPAPADLPYSPSPMTGPLLELILPAWAPVPLALRRSEHNCHALDGLAYGVLHAMPLYHPPQQVASTWDVEPTPLANPS